MNAKLEQLQAGMVIPWGGDRLTRVPADLAAAFAPGDRLVVVQTTGELLHIPQAIADEADAAVSRAREAFATLAHAPDAQITDFFEAFAANLSDEGIWSRVASANAADVERARARGASVTRLIATQAMRADMIAGLRGWRDAPAGRGRVVEHVDHAGWSVELLTAPLGVVGFVFEGRLNVLADAAGVLRGGNAVAFRIGSDALGGARAMMSEAVAPALAAVGLPAGAMGLIDSPAHGAGWALFSDPRLCLAVARGSGRAVAQLGAIARQAGVAVSLHGTGGAWLFADETADAERFAAVVAASLDRKVCNTLNVCCIVRERAGDLVPLFLEALRAAGEARGHGVKLHIAIGDERALPPDWLCARTRVRRADGEHDEPLVESLPIEGLATEWEWEETPEVTLKLVDTAAEAIALFNRFSPRFIASIISEDDAAREAFYEAVDAAFVGDGFTRWVDGQYALGRPELGLSNWQAGRLFARGGVLSGDGVFTLRMRMRQADPGLRR
ncbi:MAG TPA: aldehyde dehydrogenase family protein [Caulobacteraceae bacterium]|jgi:glutamate-5-semialdehyde dehydrogenase|nr:aldehyde dehydrogenase family protein [Caulobacteraceae bacterium]